MARVDVPGGALECEVRGEGTPVVLVHGFPLNHTMWNEQLAGLSDVARLIAPDLRGFGLSTVTPGTVTMEQFADDLAAMLDGLGVREPVVLCGLSMGGYIAWQFVRKYQERLAGLILCDTRAAPDSPEAAAGRLKTADQVLRLGPKPLADAMEPRLFAPGTVSSKPDVLAAVRQMILSTNPEGIAAAQRGMAERPDATPLLATIRVPTLLICGSEDKITPAAEMQAVAGQIAGATYAEIDGAGHMSPMEEPDVVNEAMRKFLAGISGTPATGA